MLTAYIQAAMRHATYEILEHNESYYGEIPGLQGVWGNADTLAGCREELQDALEGWLLLGLRLGHTIPPIDGTRPAPYHTLRSRLSSGSEHDPA